MQKKYFISFGGPTESWHNRVNIVCNQVKQLWSNFDTIAYTEKDLENDTEFWNLHEQFLKDSLIQDHKNCDHIRYGYYVWKPYVIFRTMQKMNDNDILIYADAGCTINPDGSSRLNEYITMVNNNTFGLVAFQSNYPEVKWTKNTLFEYFDSHEEDKRSNHYIATSVILKKTKHSMDFVQKWHDIANIHKYIDNNSYTVEDCNFVEHRWDQSIFSLLVKYYNKTVVTPVTIIGDEISQNVSNYPIWGTRIRE